MKTEKYEVVVYDNFHHNDKGLTNGEFENFDDALAVCKKIVDDFLAGIGGKNAEDMYETYCMFGDDPTIYGAKDREPFSGWDYAKQQCQMLCQSESQKNDTL